MRKYEKSTSFGTHVFGLSSRLWSNFVWFIDKQSAAAWFDTYFEESVIQGIKETLEAALE